MCQATSKPIASRTQVINMLKALYSISGQRRRRVQFDTEPITEAPAQLSFEDVKSLWYGQEELRAFKNEARRLVLTGNITRGLEGCTFERQKHRHFAIKSIVEAHRQGHGALHTATVAQRCSEWSEEVAFVQACYDYCAVYQPAMVESIPQVASINSRFQFQHPTTTAENKKRSAAACDDETEEQQERRVRRRTIVV